MAVGLTHLYSLSVFMEPIAGETGWSRARIASSLTIISVFSVTLSVFVGIAIDRLGPRRVGLYGILPYFAAIAMVGLVEDQRAIGTPFVG
jgi:MFS family permease